MFARHYMKLPPLESRPINAMPSPPPVFRFAPSPHGYMHLGNVYSALLNERMAREAGGRLLLRIEDTDTARSKPEFTEAIFEDLDWLGIAYEEPVRLQSEHMDEYRAALAKLDAQGLLYKCGCTRAKLAAAASCASDPEGQPVYPGTCRKHAPEGSGPFALRLKMDEALRRLPQRLAGRYADPGVWGDVVLGRKDSGVSYHLCVVLDDALQGVTHVVRGADVEAATSIHLVLQKLFGFPSPAYHHHRLVMHDAVRKMSKSKGDQSIRTMRSEGGSSGAVRKMLGFA